MRQIKLIKFFIDLFTVILVLVIAYGVLNEYEIIDMIKELFIKTPSVLVNNEYASAVENNYASITDDFIADSKQELLDIYFTVLASGMDEFTFYCGNEYTECENDINSLNDENTTLSVMNNFINTYNSFKSIKTTCLGNNKVIIYINKVYSDEDIIYLKDAIDKIYNAILDENDTDRNNIKKIHDYIINNTKYNENITAETRKNSQTAIGVFQDKSATCNGYTDATALLLDKLGLTNIKISNDSHIWNAVLVDNKWLHLDVTWDDPINNLGKDMLLDTFFLKTTNEFINATEKENLEEHNYNKNIYYFMN